MIKYSNKLQTPILTHTSATGGCGYPAIANYERA